MDDIRTTIKLPDDLHERVKQLAERERRTFNGQIVWLVEHALDAEEAKVRDQGATR
jgi:predicted transcriptional regulator